MPANVPMIVGPDGKPAKPVPPPEPRIRIAVNHEEETVVFIIESIAQIGNRLLALRTQVPMKFPKARAFSEAIRLAMVPPPIEPEAPIDGGNENDGTRIVEG